MLRTALVPIQIGLLKNSLLLSTITPSIDEQLVRMKRVSSEPPTYKALLGSEEGAGAVVQLKSSPGPTPDQIAAAQECLSLFKEKGCHPLKNIMSFPILMPPMILSIFGGIYACR